MWVKEALSPRGKKQNGCQADLLPPSDAQAKDTGVVYQLALTSSESAASLITPWAIFKFILYSCGMRDEGKEQERRT
jgi:hypothetical protein